MYYYKLVNPSPETRRLCEVAAQVASIQLDIATPPLRYILLDDQGSIALPKRVAGCTRAEANGEIAVYIKAADRTRQELVNTVFHEIRHMKTIEDDLRSESLTALEISERLARLFATAEAPFGDYDEIMQTLLERGAELCNSRELDKTAGEFLKLLRAKNPKRAEPIQARLNKIILLDYELSEMEMEFPTRQDRAAEYARAGAAILAEITARQKKANRASFVEFGLARARRAAEEVKRREKDILRRQLAGELWIPPIEPLKNAQEAK